MNVAVVVTVVLCAIAAAFGLKTAQLNKLNGGDVRHLIAGRVIWITAVALAAVMIGLDVLLW